MSVAENLKRIREERGITQAELADKVQVTQGMLCHIERGRKMMPLQLAKDIADALQCKVDDLLA